MPNKRAPVKNSPKVYVLEHVDDARISRTKGGWVVTSDKYEELNDISFASAKEAWADAYDTVRNGWHLSRERRLALQQDQRS